MKPKDLLFEAQCTLAKRGVQRDTTVGGDKHERSMKRIVEVFNSITDLDLTEREGWLFMLAVKLARIQAAKQFDRDSYVDLVGYTALLAECDGELHAPLNPFTKETETHDRSAESDYAFEEDRIHIHLRHNDLPEGAVEP